MRSESLPEHFFSTWHEKRETRPEKFRACEKRATVEQDEKEEERGVVVVTIMEGERKAEERQSRIL